MTGAVLLVFIAASLALDLASIVSPQSAWFDFLQWKAPRVAESTPVTIVQIDDASLASLGRWPWPRTILAQLVHLINAYGPRAIGVDIVMAEPDPLSPEHALAHVDVDAELLERLAALPSNDAELASAFAAAPTVVVLTEPGKSNEPPRTPPFVIRDSSGSSDPEAEVKSNLVPVDGAVSTLATLNDAASGWGLISGLEPQGVVRRIPLVAKVNGTVAPAFALEMWRVASRSPAIVIEASKRRIESVGVVRGDRFATERDGSVRIYFSKHHADRFVSAFEVMQETVPADRLKGRFVLIGGTAPSLGDSRWTPVREPMSGVEIHAQLLENMRDNTFLRRPVWVPWIEGLMFLLAGGFIVWMTPRASVRATALVAAACAALLLAASYGLFRHARLLLDAATPVVGLGVLLGALLALTLADATRHRKALQDVLQRQREAAARVAGELEAARRIQLDTLPRPESLHDPRIVLAASMEPAQEVGGDLYDFYMLDERRLFFMLGDVAGKGLSASIFMAVSKALCKSTMLRARDADLGALLAQANAEVSRDNPAALFVTVFAAMLDLETGALRYCNAGHENPWLVHAGGAVTRITDGGGPPLCAVDDFAYRSASLALAPGDIVCIVSDGVTEATDRSAALYGVARVERALANARTAHALVDAIRADVRTFASGAPQADDLSVLALQWRCAADAPLPCAPDSRIASSGR